MAQDNHGHVISSSAPITQRRAFKEQETNNRKHSKRGFRLFLSAMRVDRFRLACGHGLWTAFRCDAFAKPLIGILLASRVGRAVDGRKSLRKSASLVNFGGVVFVTTSKFLLFIPYTVHANVKISMLDGGCKRTSTFQIWHTD